MQNIKNESINHKAKASQIDHSVEKNKNRLEK